MKSPIDSVRPTPYLLVRQEVLDRNLLAMQGFARSAGLALRPHAKTHKMLEVAQRQIELGAIGLTVATIGEAEVFQAAGFADLFIAYPIWADAQAGARLSRLAEQCVLTVGVDSADGLRMLIDSAGPSLKDLRLRIEVDCGLRRTGVSPSESAQLAQQAEQAGAIVEGVFTYPGHGYELGASGSAAADEASALSAAADEFTRLGLACGMRSGASTPTARDTHSDVITEIRPGVYAFNDAQQVALGTVPVEEVALTVVTTVVSAPTRSWFVLDAGSKTIASDRPPYVDTFGLLPTVPGARLDRLWEHHAVVDAANVRPEDFPDIGQRIELIPNHVCTAVNLADAVVVSEDGRTRQWRVLARGRNT